MSQDSLVERPFRVATILVVDDNATDVFLLRRAFQNAGVPNPIQTLENGEEAIQYLKGDGPFADRDRFPRPAVMLLDLNMPRLNGFEVLAWARAHPEFKHLMIHVQSASSRTEDARRALDLGANAYLVKPTRLADLTSMIQTFYAWHCYNLLSQLAPR